GGLTLGSDGSFYGTTFNSGSGKIFKVTTNGTLTIWAAFGGTNGSLPHAGLTLGNDGNFYGTTTVSGTNGSYGTVFKVTTNGALTSLISLNGTNGMNPEAALMLGNDGNF